MKKIVILFIGIITMLSLTGCESPDKTLEFDIGNEKWLIDVPYNLKADKSEADDYSILYTRKGKNEIRLGINTDDFFASLDETNPIAKLSPDEVFEALNKTFPTTEEDWEKLFLKRYSNESEIFVDVTDCDFNIKDNCIMMKASIKMEGNLESFLTEERADDITTIYTGYEVLYVKTNDTIYLSEIEIDAINEEDVPQIELMLDSIRPASKEVASQEQTQ